MRKIYLLACLCVTTLWAQAQCTNPLSTFPYAENFDAGPGGWTTGGPNGTWALGTPAKPVVNSAFSAPNAWVTSSLTAPYNSSEQSFLQSPCLNFSSLSLPVIEFKIWWQTEFSWDGVVLQASTNNGATWQTIGTVGDPNNWYTDNSISGLQWTGTQEGWSGQGTNGSGGWVTARHILNNLGGQPGVLLRFAFGSDPSINGEGVAIDNVQIYDTPANDVGVTAITAPGSNCTLQPNAAVTVTVKNFGTAVQNNVPVGYQINNGPIVTGTVPGSIAPNATTTYTFLTTANLGTAGVYTFKAFTSLPTDPLHLNDTLANYTISVGSVSTYPYFQNFESGEGGWEAMGALSTWAFGTPNKTVIQGAASGTKAWVTGGLGTGDYNSNEQSWVQSPCMDFSSLVLPVIELKIWWESESGWDGAVLQASTNNGGTWATIGAFGDPNNWYNDNDLNGLTTFLGNGQGWGGSGNTGSGGYVTAKHLLTNLGGQNSVRLRIAFGADGSIQYEGIAFDDILIYETPANDVGITAITSPGPSCSLLPNAAVTVTVKNFGSASQSNIPVVYRLNNGPLQTGTVPGPLAPNATTSFTFPGTANLGTAGVYTFETWTALGTDALHLNDTLPDYVIAVGSVSSYPYFQDFEGGTAGWEAKGTPKTWAFGTPAKSVIQGAASGANAWVTGGLGMGQYAANEHSWVESPCFNLSGLTSPVIEMSIWWSTDMSADGAVLQSSTNNGTSWQNVGFLGDSVNWYNYGNISGLQWASSSSGWSGNGSSASPGWITARHDLSGLGGNSSVRLRIAFGSDGFGQADGFAFDNVRIYDKPQHDLRVTSLVPLQKACGLDTAEVLRVRIRNYGTNPASNFTVSYQLDNNAVVTQPFTGTIAALGNTTFTFSQPANLSNPGSYAFKAWTTHTPDTITNDTLKTSIFNTLIALNAPTPMQKIDFETGPGSESIFSIETRQDSRVQVNTASARFGQYGMVMHGGSPVGWIPVVSVPGIPANDPWNPVNNPTHFAAADLCMSTANLDSLRIRFSLKQLKGSDFTETNFRLTVNGQPVPLNRGSQVNALNLTPPVIGPSLGWQDVTADLTPFLAASGNMVIGFESSVRSLFSAGTGNMLDDITLTGRLFVGREEDNLSRRAPPLPEPNQRLFHGRAPG